MNPDISQTFFTTPDLDAQAIARRIDHVVRRVR
jgi:hypothetical protein